MLVRDHMRCMAALGTPVKGGWQERPAKPAAPPCSPVQCYTSVHDIIYSLLLFMNTGSLVLLTPTGGRCGCEFEFRLLKGAERDQSCRKRQPPKLPEAATCCPRGQPTSRRGSLAKRIQDVSYSGHVMRPKFGSCGLDAMCRTDAQRESF